MNLVNRLVSAFLILTHTMWKTQANECCPMKMVGSTSYTLLAEHFHGKLPDQCTNSCVYTITNTSAPKFCFKKVKKSKKIIFGEICTLATVGSKCTSDLQVSCRPSASLHLQVKVRKCKYLRLFPIKSQPSLLDGRPGANGLSAPRPAGMV